MSRRSRRRKHIYKDKRTDEQRRREGKRVLIVSLSIVVAIVAAVVILFLVDKGKQQELFDMYDAKAAMLREAVVSDELDGDTAENAPESVVFISVCDSTERARVFTGTGSDIGAAFDAANEQAKAYVEEGLYDAKWVKADIVNSSEAVSSEELYADIGDEKRNEFYRRGIAFDSDFGTALLEAELNGNKIIDYDDDCFDFEYLNNYLRKNGRDTLSELPSEYITFTCDGWLCDENSELIKLNNSGYEYGRRDIDVIDADYAAELVRNASGFLMEQLNDDGSFIYGIYPRFDKEIENYNIVRHASTLWSLVCQYRMTENEKLIPDIEKAIDYMIDTGIVYSDDNTAYLLEGKNSEIKLGGCSVAVIALTEYMDCFGNDKYADLAVKLGNGILTMFESDTGEYYHILDSDFNRKEAFRTVYYDGEATFAFSRLYALTGDESWLDCAKKAVDHFIEANYEQYRDHWVAYTMNELTKHVDDEKYYEFALRNAQENLKAIIGRDTTYHTYFELLMATFEVYDRMIERGIDVKYAETDFDLEYFLKTIYSRADHLLNGYFFPEYAMYMQNPQRILNTFMVRHDGYRVRIDDVQHNVGGYYLYYKNYDKLVDYGMLECRDK